MADDIIARIREEGLSNFVKLIVEAGKETKKTGKEVDSLNTKLDNSKKSSKSVAELTKDVNRLEKELKQAKMQADKTFDTKEVKKLERELKKTNKETGRLTSGFGSVKKAVAGAFAAATIVEFTKVVVKAAIEIDSTNAKLNKVFGDSAKSIDNFAKRSANSLGQTTNEYKKAAAAAGDLLIPIGFQRQEAAELSGELINLSGALAAWSGGQVDATQVSQILTKALLGEREQLKSLGISITEADVSTRLLEKGQKNLTGTLLQQAKAQATLELITEKSTDAQRAFSDETETLAEKQLKLSAQFRQFRDGLATTLIPVVSDFFDLFSFGGTVITALIEDIGELLNLGEDELQKIEAYGEEAEKIARDNLAFQKEGLELAKARDVIDQDEIDAIQAAVDLRQQELDRILALNKAKKIGGDEDKRVAGSLEDLNQLLKEQAEIIKTSSPLSDEFENAVVEAERLKDEIDKINELIKILARGEIEQIPAAVETIDGNLKDLLPDFEDLDESLKDGADSFGDLATSALDAFDRIEIITKGQSILDNLLGFEEGDTPEDKAAKSIQAASNAATTITNILSSAYNRQLENLRQKNEQGLLSDKEYDRQRAEILTRQARAEKAGAVIQSVINTALGVTKAFPNPVLMGIIGAIGAAKTALIASQPIPEFKDGVKGFKGGLAIVGDGGQKEPITDKKGKLIGVSGNKPTLVNLPKGANVFSNEENYISDLLSKGVPIQYNYDMLSSKINTSTPSIDDFVKNKSTSQQIKNSLSGINLEPLLYSNDVSRFYIGKKLDNINKTLKSSNYTTKRNG